MKHLMIVFSLCALLISSGCQFVQQVDKIPLDKQCQLISSITRTTTYIALQESINDKVKRAEVATKIVSVANWLNVDTPSLSQSLISDTLGKYFTINDNQAYGLLLQNALDILMTYYDPKIDVADTIGPDNVARLRAFLTGMSQGAQLCIPNAKGEQSNLYYDSSR